MLRAPKVAVPRPAQVAAMIDEARKAVLGRLIMLAPPSSPTTVGSTVASISTFIECSRMPPSSTASAPSHSRRSSMLQPSRRTAPCSIGADYARVVERYHRTQSKAFSGRPQRGGVHVDALLDIRPSRRRNLSTPHQSRRCPPAIRLFCHSTITVSPRAVQSSSCQTLSGARSLTSSVSRPSSLPSTGRPRSPGCRCRSCTRQYATARRPAGGFRTLRLRWDRATPWRLMIMSATEWRGPSELLRERAAAFVQGAEGVVAGDGRDPLHQVPFALRLLGRLGLHQIHVAYDLAVDTDLAVLGHEVV